LVVVVQLRIVIALYSGVPTMRPMRLCARRALRRAKYGAPSPARACAGQPARADDLEAAVIDDLLRVYQDLDLVEGAILGAYEDTSQEPAASRGRNWRAPRAQLRETTSALDRYLWAFRRAPCPTPSAPRGWPSFRATG